MAQTKPKAGQFYGVSNNGTDGEFLQTDGTGGMAWAPTITDPTITSIDYPGSATAADPAGGESVIINGTLFASGITCTVGGTSAVTAFNSATQITITTPAKAAGPYTVAVLNPNGGTASQANFIQYSGVPVWSTAAGTLGNVIEGGAASFQVTATEGSDTIEYAVTTGTLPTGLSLATATGAITGTAPAVSADTTTTFSITATDDENQTSASRSFSITVQNDGPSNHFNTVLYTGNNSTQSISTVGFEPGMIWFKNRNGTNAHAIVDVVRTRSSYIYPNLPNAANSSGATNDVTSFDSLGFSLGSVSNAGSTNTTTGGSNNLVAWCFKAGGAAVANTDGTINSNVSVNNTLGFSIVSYTGNGVQGATVGHGLSSAPEFIVVKSLDNTAQSESWNIYALPLGNQGTMFLNSNGAKITGVATWGNTTPTSSVFSIGSYSGVNYLNDDLIAYCFTSKPGFSKVGSYTGNGTSQSISTGFEVGFVLIKSTTSSQGWMMYDSTRGGNKYLEANSAAAEGTTASNLVNFYSNGFGVTNSNSENQSGQTFIYLAFAVDGSTATPSLANSFATEIYTGTSSTQSITGTGFKPDFTWIKNRLAGGTSHNLFTPLYGQTGYYLKSNTTDALSPTSEIGAYGISAFNSDGFTLVGPGGWTNANGNSYVSWNWKAGGTPSINTDGSITSLVSANQAAGFSVVKYNGNSNSGTVGHGLSQTPELFFIKTLSMSAQWLAIDTSSQTGGYLSLTDSFEPGRYNAWLNNANPTNTIIPLGALNYVSGDMIMYCFTSISGYSKVGSYVGGGNTNPTINVGFTPSWLMVKRATGGNAGWTIVDNKRHPGTPTYVNGNVLYADEDLEEQDDDNIRGFNITSTGFTPNGNYASTNNSGDTYIYLAIKEN